jgi:hypothetical protein
MFLSCNFIFSDAQYVQNGISVRLQSTSINTAIQSSVKIKKKKVRRLRKKYAELVEGKKSVYGILI